MMDDHASGYNPFKKKDLVTWFEDIIERERERERRVKYR